MNALFRTRSRLIAIVVPFLFAAPASAATITLDFNSLIPGTLLDKDGNGTGFTHRLPGTGSAIPTNDPNMDLTSAPGKLLLTSTDADINGARNLSTLQAVGFYLPGVHDADIRIRMRVNNVDVENPSDQLFLYAGTSATQVIRSGVHNGNVYHITSNTGAHDSIDFSTGGFNPLDDIILTFARTNGYWTIAWDNLTDPSRSGVSDPKLYPWLNASPDLYVGVLASNARSTITFSSEIEYLSVTANVTVPAASSLTYALLAAASFSLYGRIGPRRRSGGPISVG